MARLTRTQKYAELRNQLENSRETQLETEDLSKYEDRLNQLHVDGLPKEEETKPVEEKSEEEIKKELNDSLDRLLAQMNADVQRHIGPKVEESFKEETIEETPEEVKEEVLEESEEVSSDAEEEPVQAPIKEAIQEKAEPEVSEEKVEDVKEGPVQEAEPEVKEEKAAHETISIEDLMRSDIDDNYIKDTLDEVKAYNKSLGSITADDLPKTILSEIRGESEAPKQEDDLSNTVTLEIKKILSELDEPETKEEAKEVIEEEKPEVKEEPITPISIESPLIADALGKIEPEKTKEEAAPTVDIDELRRAVDGLPKDVGDLLRQYLESTQEDVFAEPKKEEIPVPQEEPLVAEVKPEVTSEVKETPKEPSPIEAALMNETMPLQVEKTAAMPKLEDEEDEYEEEGASSKVLNVILIILIVILVLVLIVVAYLILVAQGIIPSLF